MTEPAQMTPPLPAGDARPGSRLARLAVHSAWVSLLLAAATLAVFSLGAVESAKAGKPVDLTESLKTVSTTVNELDDLERQMDRTKLDAKVYARDNKLF